MTNRPFHTHQMAPNPLVFFFPSVFFHFSSFFFEFFQDFENQIAQFSMRFETIFLVFFLPSAGRQPIKSCGEGSWGGCREEARQNGGLRAHKGRLECGLHCQISLLNTEKRFAQLKLRLPRKCCRYVGFFNKHKLVVSVSTTYLDLILTVFCDFFFNIFSH